MFIHIWHMCDTNLTQQEPVLKNQVDQAAEGSILIRLWNNNYLARPKENPSLET